MITIRINAKTHDQTVIEDNPATNDKGIDALATILAGWIHERRDAD